MWFLSGIHGCITVVAQKPALIGLLQGIHFERALLVLSLDYLYGRKF